MNTKKTICSRKESIENTSFDGFTLPLGQLTATSGAIDLLDRVGTNASALLKRHQSGDWGDIDTEDAKANDWAVLSGQRILSVYRLGKDSEPLWIITEANRNLTTLLLPNEY